MNFEEVNVHSLIAEVFQLINVQLRLKSNVFLIRSVAQDTPTLIESDY